MKNIILVANYIFLLINSFVNSSPLITCSDFASCLKDWTITKNNEAGCGECSYTLCVTLDTTLNTCIKAGSAISHYCQENQVCIDPISPSYSAYYTKSNGSVTQTLCATDAGGEIVSFVFADGGGSGTCTADLAVDPFVVVKNEIGEYQNLNVKCGSWNPLGSSGSCGGQTKECVFTVQLPSCETAPPTEEPPVYKCPAGKTCATKDCQCVFGSCNPIKMDEKTTASLLGCSDGISPCKMPLFCPNGKALSNSVIQPTINKCNKVDCGDSTCTLPIPGRSWNKISEVPPFEMKCGRDCYIYGDFQYACNF